MARVCAQLAADATLAARRAFACNERLNIDTSHIHTTNSNTTTLICTAARSYVPFLPKTQYRSPKNVVDLLSPTIHTRASIGYPARDLERRATLDVTSSLLDLRSLYILWRCIYHANSSASSMSIYNATPTRSPRQSSSLLR